MQQEHFIFSVRCPSRDDRQLLKKTIKKLALDNDVTMYQIVKDLALSEAQNKSPGGSKWLKN